MIRDAHRCLCNATRQLTGCIRSERPLLSDLSTRGAHAAHGFAIAWPQTVEPRPRGSEIRNGWGGHRAECTHVTLFEQGGVLPVVPRLLDSHVEHLVVAPLLQAVAVAPADGQQFRV